MAALTLPAPSGPVVQHGEDSASVQRTGNTRPAPKPPPKCPPACNFEVSQPGERLCPAPKPPPKGPPQPPQPPQPLCSGVVCAAPRSQQDDAGSSSLVCLKPPPKPPPAAHMARCEISGGSLGLGTGVPRAGSSSVMEPKAVLASQSRSTLGTLQIQPLGRPTPRKRIAELVTFGLETCDAELAALCQQSVGGGAWARCEDADLRAALERRCVPDARAAILVDARRFPDPDASQHTRHVGLHPKIIMRICQHRNFRRWLTWVKSEFDKAYENRTAAAGETIMVTIALYCRVGKHRSVATAVVLAYILAAEGWDCHVKHLSMARWGKSCWGECEECRGWPDELSIALDDALKVWRIL